jgi:hypothetical protein
VAVMDQELKDFFWQELKFHMKEATRKEPKSNKDEIKKYSMDTILFYHELSPFTKNRHTHIHTLTVSERSKKRTL